MTDPPGFQPSLSAVICTRDRPDLLRDCLATLMAQDIDPPRFEVLVVDDGSTDPLAPVVESFAGAGVAVRYERQAPTGLPAARNHGIESARGGIIAFLDDDTLVSPGWVSAVVESFERFHCQGLAGRIELRLEGPAPRWLGPRLRGYLSELDYGPRPRVLDKEFPYGANCAVMAAAARALGGFRTGLGRTGTTLRSNEEIEFFGRLRRSGGTVVYAPDASVLHRVPASRLDPQWFRRRAYAQGVSDVLLDPPDATPDRWRRAGTEVLRAALAAPILVKNVAQGRGTVSARAWLALCAGRLRALTADAGTAPPTQAPAPRP